MARQGCWGPRVGQPLPEAGWGVSCPPGNVGADGEEREGWRLRWARRQRPPRALPSAALAAVPDWPACGHLVCSDMLTVSQTLSLGATGSSQESTGPRSRGGGRAQRGQKARPWPGLSAGLLGFVPLPGHVLGPGGRATGRWRSGERLSRSLSGVPCPPLMADAQGAAVPRSGP